LLRTTLKMIFSIFGFFINGTIIYSCINQNGLLWLVLCSRVTTFVFWVWSEWWNICSFRQTDVLKSRYECSWWLTMGYLRFSHSAGLVWRTGLRSLAERVSAGVQLRPLLIQNVSSPSQSVQTGAGPQTRSGRHVEPEERAERESASVTESFRRHGPSVTRFVTTHDASYIRDAALISFLITPFPSLAPVST